MRLDVCVLTPQSIKHRDIIMSMELIRFLFVGVGSNVINFMMYLAFYSVGVSLFMASILGYSCGLIFSYHFGRIWVFGRKFNVSNENLTRFVVVYAVGGIGMSALIEFLDRTTALDYRVSWFFGAIFAVINNFVGQKWLVFNGRK